MTVKSIDSARTERQERILREAQEECAQGGVVRVVVILRNRDGLVTFDSGGDQMEALGMLSAAVFHLHDACASEVETEPVA